MSEITVKVSFMGEIRSLAGRRAMELVLAEGTTVQGLLAHLCETLGEAFAKRLFDGDGRLYEHVVVFVDGKDAREFQGLQTQLVGGEVDILILPVWDGGQER